MLIPRIARFAVLVRTLVVVGAMVGIAQAQYLPVNATPAPYVVSPFPDTAHCMQKYRLYLPPPSAGAMPPAGWPVLVHLNISGFNTSGDIASVDPDGFFGDVLESGIALVTARATISRIAVQWTECAAPDGHGLFHPPGVLASDQLAGDTPRYDDPMYDMAEKDAVMIIQHVKYMARQAGGTGGPLEDALALLDENKVAVHGRSAGAISLMWPTFGPDRRTQEPFLSLQQATTGVLTQFDEDPRPHAAILRGGMIWWPILHPALTPLVSHFGLGGDSEDPAPSIADASTVELEGASSLFYQDCNATFAPVYLAYGELSVSTDHGDGFDCLAPVFTFVGGGMEADPSDPDLSVHPAWSGYTWKNTHPADDIRLVIARHDSFSQKSPAIEAALILDQPPLTDNVDCDIREWLHDALALSGPAPRCRWNEIVQVGGASAGVGGIHGIPGLGGMGTMLPAATTTIAIAKGVPSGTTGLVIGFSALNMPFKGGVLVPTNDAVITPIALDIAGNALVTFPWPSSVPSTTPVWYQVWMLDATAPVGFSGSNAIISVSP